MQNEKLHVPKSSAQLAATANQRKLKSGIFKTAS
jgi:hypothetical protein